MQHKIFMNKAIEIVPITLSHLGFKCSNFYLEHCRFIGEFLYLDRAVHVQYDEYAQSGNFIVFVFFKKKKLWRETKWNIFNHSLALITPFLTSL